MKSQTRGQSDLEDTTEIDGDLAEIISSAYFGSVDALSSLNADPHRHRGISLNQITGIFFRIEYFLKIASLTARFIADRAICCVARKNPKMVHHTVTVTEKANLPETETETETKAKQTI